MTRQGIGASVLWGFHPAYNNGLPLKLARSTKEATRRYLSEGWTVAVYRRGEVPAGLRIQAEEAKTKLIPGWRCKKCASASLAASTPPNKAVMVKLAESAREHELLTLHPIERIGIEEGW